jgi:hypothetical protein
MKFVFGGLAVVLLVCGVMSFTGCQTETEEPVKVVEAKYRGTWVYQYGSEDGFILYEKTWTDLAGSNTMPAYTEGNVLYVGESGGESGTFENDTTFKDHIGDIYLKQ